MDTVLRTLGPLDFYVVQLPNRDALPFEAVRELLSLADAEIIDVVDLVLVERAPDSSVSVVEARQLDPPHPLSVFSAEVTPLLTPLDLEALARPLPPGGCFAVIVVENLWAKSLQDTLTHWECPVIRRGPIANPPPASTSTTDERERLPWPAVLADDISRPQ